MTNLAFLRAMLSAGMLLLAAAGPALADGADPRQAIAVRQQRIRQIGVEYARVTRYDPDPNLGNMPRPHARVKVLPPVRRTESFTERLDFMEGGMRYYSERSKADVDAATRAGAAVNRASGLIIRADRCEALEWPAHSAAPVGAVSETAEYPILLAMDLALGLKLYQEPGWLTPERLEAAEVVPGTDADETVLRIKTAGGTVHSLSFSKRLGYALTHYHIEYPQPESFEDVVCSEFKEVGGLFLPFRYVREGTYRDTGGRLRHPIVTTLTVTKYDLSHGPDADDRFTFKWPRGSSVADRRNKATIRVDVDGDRLTDERIFTLLQEREENDRKLEDKAAREVEAILKGAPRPEGEPADGKRQGR
jgi:hypothetical protein